MIEAFIENHFSFLFDKEHVGTTERLLDLVKRAQEQDVPTFSDFVHEGFRDIFQKAIEGHGLLKMAAWPAQGERSILGFFPTFYQVKLLEPPLVLMESPLDLRFEKISHSDVLGALMHLGVERHQFGDILFDGKGCQVFCTESIAPVVERELLQIRRSPVHFSFVPISSSFSAGEEGREVRLTPASMRLDSVVAAGFSQSRNTAQRAIESGHVKVNHFVRTQQKMTVEVGDLLSLSKKGRLRVIERLGTTRKDRIVLRARLMSR